MRHSSKTFDHEHHSHFIAQLYELRGILCESADSMAYVFHLLDLPGYRDLIHSSPQRTEVVVEDAAKLTR